jgi:RHS repeat-associated protein
VQYLYEGAQALGEIRNGQLSHRLLTGLSLDETIARIAVNTNGTANNANSRIYITDALNSVIAQLGNDSNATVQTSYGYSPYGQTEQIGPDATNNPNQYTSRENDNTGLMFYRARYYDPVLKRFISEDPIGLLGGMNKFAYVEGNPISRPDPKGLQAIIPTPVGPMPLPPPVVLPPGGAYPPPDFDPLRDTRPEVRIPSLEPKVPKGPGRPNDPEGGGACRRMLESCMQAANSNFCPTPLKPPVVAMCLAAYAGCMLALGD